MERGTETGERTSNGGLTEVKKEQACKNAVTMPDSDSKGYSKYVVLYRILYGTVGFILGIFAAVALIGYRIIIELEWLSWPVAIVIAILTPGTFGIIAVCNARRLYRFFHSRFWRRFVRIALGCIGMAAMLFGVLMLAIGVKEISLLTILGALVSLAVGLWALWTVLRGTDNDVSDFFDGWFGY